MRLISHAERYSVANVRLQWICAGLGHGTRYCARRKLPYRGGVFLASRCEKCAHCLIDHEIESDLEKAPISASLCAIPRSYFHSRKEPLLRP